MLLKGFILISALTFVCSCGNFSERGMNLPPVIAPVTLPPTPEFPWPPPKASAKKVLPNTAFSGEMTFKEVDSILSRALEMNGYEDKSYFSAPAKNNYGFVLVTQMEQINDDATSKPDIVRWNDTLRMEDLTFGAYLKSIFFSEKGYYRVIVFVVSDLAFNQSEEFPERDTAISWLQIGTNKLPGTLSELRYTNDFTITALIYEYELKEQQQTAKLQKPSKHSGKTHLVKAKLWDAILN